MKEYYFKKNKLIFALEIVTGGAAAGPDKKTEYRYYLKEDKAIRQLQNNQVVTIDSKFSDVLENSYKLLKIRNSSDFEAAFSGA